MNSDEFIEGRPYGRVAIVWRPTLCFDIKEIPTESNRLIACRLENVSHKILLFNLYMPCRVNLGNEEYLNILYEIMSIVKIYSDYNIVIGGDFNTNFVLNDYQVNILTEFSTENDLICVACNGLNIEYSFIDKCH